MITYNNGDNNIGLFEYSKIQILTIQQPLDGRKGFLHQIVQV